MTQKKPQTSPATLLRTRRYLIISVISWLVMALMLFVVVIPRIQMTMALRTENENSRLALEKLQDKGRFLESFRSSEFERLNTAVQRILPSNKPFLQMLFTLEQLSVEHSVFFGGLDVNPGLIASDSAALESKESRSGILHLDLKLTIYGSSAQINSFMDKITTVAPALDVKTFSSSTQRSTVTLETDAASAIHKADINVSSLYAPIAFSSGARQALPTLTTEENTYAQTQIPTYMIYSQSQQSAPDLNNLGKEDPFSL